MRRSNRYPFDFETEVGENDEIMMHAAGYVTEYRPATMYARNGDPGDPAEGGEVEIEELTFTDGEGNDVDYVYDDDWLDDLCIDHTDFSYFDRGEE